MTGEAQMLGSRRDATSNGAKADHTGACNSSINARLIATDEEATIERRAQVLNSVART
jgi:hypothetical protein